MRINDFRAAAARPEPSDRSGRLSSVLVLVRLPNPVIFGPGDFGDPSGLTGRGRRRSLSATDPTLASGSPTSIGRFVATR